VYNDIIINNFMNPSCSKTLSDCNASFEVGNSVCGDRIQVSLNVESGIIVEAAFQAWGCATSVATANVFCQAIKGLPLADIQNKSDAEIDEMLGELEPSQEHCLTILKELYHKVGAS